MKLNKEEIIFALIVDFIKGELNCKVCRIIYWILLNYFIYIYIYIYIYII